MDSTSITVERPLTEEELMADLVEPVVNDDPAEISIEISAELVATAGTSKSEERANLVVPSEVEGEDEGAVAVVRDLGALGQSSRSREASASRPDSATASKTQPASTGANPSEVEAPEDETLRPGLPSLDVDARRMAKAELLYQEALKDRASGNLVSARMNLKLALTFYPGNRAYLEALSALDKHGTPEERAVKAKQYFDRATDAEKKGRYDEAIAVLEEAITNWPDAPLYNRLGVLLATRKHEFERAQAMLAEALRRSPDNPAYENNLSKILQLAAKASLDGSSASGKTKKRSILGFLSRKK